MGGIVVKQSEGSHANKEASIKSVLHGGEIDERLTHQNIEDIIKSWESIHKHGLIEVGVDVFKQLFVAAPETFLLFDFRDNPDWETSTDFRHHCYLVMNFFGSCVSLLRNHKDFASSLKYLGFKHFGLAITTRHFELMGVAVHQAFLTCLGPESYTEEVKQAWDVLYWMIMAEVLRIMAMKAKPTVLLV